MYESLYIYFCRYESGYTSPKAKVKIIKTNTFVRYGNCKQMLEQ